MSTKIYNGWRIDGVSLDELLKRLVRIGKAVRKQAQDFACDLIAHHAVGAIDRYMIRRKKTEVWFKLGGYVDSVLHSYMWEVDKMIGEALRSMERRPIMDLGCDVSIHPISDKGKPTILLLLYCENSHSYEKLWKRIVRAKPFEYYDNTDLPDGISQKEWDARGRLWEKALPGVTAPVETGYGFKCVTEMSVNFFLVGSDDFLKHVPSTDERIEDATWDWAVDIALKRNLKKAKKHNEIKEWLRNTPAGKRLVEECRAKVKAKLPNINKDVLLMSSKKVLVERPTKTK